MVIPDGLRDLLLGREPSQRLRVTLTLVAWLTYLLFAVVQHVEVVVGLIDEAASWRLTAFTLSGATVFLVLVRLDVGRRWLTDSQMMLVQGLWAMVAISWSYAITGPARGALIVIMVLVLLFGIFRLAPQGARWLAVSGFALLCLVSATMALRDPVRYDPRVEFTHLVVAAVVMGAAARLASHFGELRDRVERQRAELQSALERIQALVTRDELTGLATRRAAVERLGALGTDTLPACVVMIDLDHFKQINDTHGHAVGDEVLRHFGRLAREVVRTEDLLARWGGEEFLLVMPRTTPAQTLGILERLRARLREQPVAPGGAALVTTFSAGVAACTAEGGAAMDGAIARADAALYAAKRAGRDRALLDTSTPGVAA